MIREPHVLEAGGTQNKPKRIIFFDSESHVDLDLKLEDEGTYKEHDLYMICANFQRELKPKYHTYRVDHQDDISKKFWIDVDKFTIFRERTVMFAHNAGYDMLVTNGITELLNLGYEVTNFHDANPYTIEFTKYITHKRNGQPYGEYVDEIPEEIVGENYVSKKLIPYETKNGFFIPKPKTKKILVLSSTNYYQASLQSLGKTFGLEKLDFEHGEEINYDDAEVYCIRDVEILTVAVNSFFNFVETENLGGFSITVAGQSFKAYRHRFLKDEIYIHANESALNVERRAYAGGRTEVFKLGRTDNVYYYDINSMYPAVMKNNKYPTELISFRMTMDIEELKNIIEKGYLICADVLVSTEEPVYLYKEKRLLFPTGEFWTSLSTPEIIHALKHGHILQLKNIAIYESGDIFSDFVEYFYNQRLQAKEKNDNVNDLLYKLILNCLYGKFGQRNEHMIYIGDCEIDDIGVENYYDSEHGMVYVKKFGGKIWAKDKSVESTESYNSFPAIASHVTSYARMLLWDGIQTAGLENVIYCDTDSLVLTYEGHIKMDNLKHESKLGYYDLEKTGDIIVHGGKDYIFINDKGGEEVKLKGVSKNALRVEGEEKETYLVSQWGTLSSNIQKGTTGGFANRIIRKTLKREYLKGDIQEDGQVKPFHFTIEDNKVNEQELMLYELFHAEKIILPKRGEKLYEHYTKLKNKYRILCFRKNGIKLDEFLKINNLTFDELKNLWYSL